MYVLGKRISFSPEEADTYRGFSEEHAYVIPNDHSDIAIHQEIVDRPREVFGRDLLTENALLRIKTKLYQCDYIGVREAADQIHPEEVLSQRHEYIAFLCQKYQIAAYKAIAFAEEGKLEEAKPFFLEALLYEFSQLYSVIEPIGVEFLDLFYYGSTVYQNIQTYYPDTVDETFLGGIIDIFKDTPEALGKSICNYFRKENGKIQQVTAFGDIIIILKAMSESGEEKVFQIERYRLYDLLKHDENGYYVIEFEDDDLDLFDSCFKGKSLEEFAKELHALFPKR